MATAVRPPRTPAQISEVMGRVPSRDTEPELLLRKALRRAGIRSFRVCDLDLPGKPDIVIPGRQLAIFVDGDFWHGNQYKLRGYDSLEQQLSGVRNAAYWKEKVARNMSRDLENTAALLDAGWQVLRFWESQIHDNADACVQRVSRALEARRLTQTHNFGALPGRATVELFAGIGLVRAGLDAEGWPTVFANDNDPQKYQMYAANFNGVTYDQRSIVEIRGKDIPSTALLTASFPCNDLSLAGARNGLNGAHSGMFWEVIRLLREMKGRKPPLILLENVFGFLTSHGGRDFEAAISALNQLGYACDAFVLDAANFVPQSRVRLFVVAKPSTTVRSQVHSLTESPLRPKQLVTFIREHPHLNWSVAPLPPIVQTTAKLTSILEDLADDDPNWWSRERAEYFFNQLSDKHRRAADAMIAGTEYTFATAFRRVRNGRSMAELRFDGIAGCLRTPRGGSGRQILFRAGKGGYSVRLLTARECARLQGVSDKYRITVPLNHALFGFGDAVCVPAIRWIARNYLTPLASELMRDNVLVATT